MSLVQAQQEPVIKMAVLLGSHFYLASILDKNEFRKKIKILCLQNQKQLAKQSTLICKKILASPQFQNAQEIFAYMALPDEVDLSEVIKQALQDGKKVALPKIISKTDGIMQFFYLDSQKALAQQTSNGAYGILEPDENMPATLDTTHKTLILVPGRAFTKDGDRLGRGKGYYDRYLAKGLGMGPFESLRDHGHHLRNHENVIIAGVCFDFQILDTIPTAENDICMNTVFF